MNRLPFSPTQKINRDKELRFSYRGQPYMGYDGDTIATALYASGERVFSRSLKYHRPRGLYNLDGLTANLMMSVDGLPNVRACKTPLRQGMVVEPQNVMGSPEWDLMSVIQWFSFAMPVGFYYKIFHKPAWIWPLALKGLRRAAGFGKIDEDAPDGFYDHRYLNAEVCVIGGGPAGMAAALEAAKEGVRVVLIESRDCLGGALAYRPSLIVDGMSAPLYASKMAENIGACDNIRVLTNTTATGLFQSNHVTAVRQGVPGEDFRQRYYEVRAKSVVVATGTIERPLIFHHNDAPGVMQGSCAQQLLHLYGIKPGARAVVSGAHDGMLEVAADLARAGVRVVAALDARKEGFDENLAARLQGFKIPFFAGKMATRAQQMKTLKGVSVSSFYGDSGENYDCDLLVASAGEAPLSQILQVAGVKMAYNPAAGKYLPDVLPPALYAAGGVMGLDNASAIVAQGSAAGLRALRNIGLDVSRALDAAEEKLNALPGPAVSFNPADAKFKGKKCFVDFDEDVTVDQIKDAIDEAFDATELIKRYTTAGTGPGQSYLCGQNLPLITAKLRGLKPGNVAPTTVRPPISPTGMAVLGGRRPNPYKLTPLHERQVALGGDMQLAGVWMRAHHFGESSGIFDEVMNVRSGVGYIDVSTLGKFKVFGPDAAKLLQRVYVNDIGKVIEGKVSYSVMCNEQGVIIDDGVITKTGPDEYYITTSSVRASNTIEWMKFHSKEEQWRAYIVNLTDAYIAINLAGPKSREVMSALTDEDVGNENMRYMQIRKMTLCGGVECLVMRIGFVGELSYEIHAPASYGLSLHEAMEKAGKPFGIKPFGLEAQSIMRLEKGHVIIGRETENYSTIHDIGMSWVWARGVTEKAKTVGSPALKFTESQTHRQKLVGFIMEAGEKTPADGSVIVSNGVIKGRVCTLRYSPSVQQSIGMALVDPELVEMNGTLEIYEPGKLTKEGTPPEIKTVTARIAPMPFYDPKGARLRS